MLMWALLAVAGVAFLVDRAALLTLRPPRRPPEQRAADLGYPVTPVEIESGSVTLRGHLLEPDAARDDAPVAVLVHGWTGDASTMLHVAGPLLAAGFPVLAFDVRSHGRSDRAPAVTVRHFRDDLMAVVRYVRALRPEGRVVAIGHSLGGSAAILAQAKGARLAALALIATPADLFAATAGFFSDRGLPGGLLVKLFHPSWRLRAGESFRSLDPEAGAREIGGSIPMIVIQGDRDRRAPPGDAERLSRAAGAPLTVVPGAAHRDVLVRPETHRELVRFLGSLPA